MSEGSTVFAEHPLGCKKAFEKSVINPSENGICLLCKGQNLCKECKLKTKQLKEFSANLIEMKRKEAIGFDHLLPYYIGGEFEVFVYLNLKRNSNNTWLFLNKEIIITHFALYLWLSCVPIKMWWRYLYKNEVKKSIFWWRCRVI